MWAGTRPAPTTLNRQIDNYVVARFILAFQSFCSCLIYQACPMNWATTLLFRRSTLVPSPLMGEDCGESETGQNSLAFLEQ